MDFERGLVVDQVTGWMNDKVGQQRLRAVEQRVSPAGGLERGKGTSAATRT